MRLLLDTCVVSELQREDCDANVRATVDSAREQDLFLSVVTLGELVRGVDALDEGRRRRELTAWMHSLQREAGDRLLPIDAEVARLWGRLTADASRRGRTVPMADGLIAATAMAHGLTVATRNLADFEPTGVMVRDPWQG